MTAWRRWQDWGTILLGVLVFATPFIFGIDLGSTAAWTTYVIGALLMAGGAWSASTDEPNPSVEWIPLILGGALILAPWALGFTNVVQMAWMSWILGALVILNSGAELFVLGQRPAAA